MNQSPVRPIQTPEDQFGPDILSVSETFDAIRLYNIQFQRRPSLNTMIIISLKPHLRGLVFQSRWPRGRRRVGRRVEVS